MVQIMQFLHMQGDPFHFLSNVLNSEIFSIVLIPLNSITSLNVSLPAAEFANWVGQSAILHRMAFLSTTITLCRCTGWLFGRW